MLAQILLKIFRTTFKLVERISSSGAGKWALRLFATPRKPVRPEWEESFLNEAERARIPFNSHFSLDERSNYYIRYSWGEGPVVLLAHGWEGRGTQMGLFIRPFVDAGYRVVAFDAPAHGDSPGKRTNLLEFVQVIKEIAQEVEGFYAIIGHSLGGVAGAFAIREGVKCGRLITIGSPASMDVVLSGFAGLTGASDHTIAYLVDFMERFSGKNLHEFSLAEIISQLHLPGLIVHDEDDAEIPYQQALILSKKWENSQLITTRRLGHRRILKDEEMISKIVSFLGDQQKDNSLRNTGY